MFNQEAAEMSCGFFVLRRLIKMLTDMAFWNTARRINVILVSNGITDQDAKKIGIRSVKTIDEAFNLACSVLGTDNPTVGVIPYGADVIPVLDSKC